MPKRPGKKGMEFNLGPLWTADNEEEGAIDEEEVESSPLEVRGPYLECGLATMS